MSNRKHDNASKMSRSTHSGAIIALKIGAMAGLAGLGGLLSLGGCSQSPAPEPLNRQAFYPPGQSQIRPNNRDVDNPDSDINGPHLSPQVQIPLNPKLPPPASPIRQNPDVTPTPATSPSGRSGGHAPDHQSVDAGMSARMASSMMGASTDSPTESTTESSTGASTGSPKPPKVGESLGEFQILGTVVAQVNGVPIYANKILATIEKPLREKARILDRDSFRNFAIEQIGKQVALIKDNELALAAANRFLSDDDKHIADAMTLKWRREQITDAGGSLELAKKRAADDDSDFEDLALSEYHSNLIGLYFEKRIEPRVQVTAQDMRDYYNKNLATEFTVLDAAVFRVIKVDDALVGSRTQAYDKAKDLWERARNGENFIAMATKENHNAAWAANGGLVSKDPIQRGAFSIDKIEKAVWSTKEGQVADLIDNGDAFYIVKVEKLVRGSVRPFDDEETQDYIHRKLRAIQVSALRQQEQAELMKGAIFRVDEAMMDVTVDMAMQQYPIWAAAK